MSTRRSVPISPEEEFVTVVTVGRVSTSSLERTSTPSPGQLAIASKSSLKPCRVVQTSVRVSMEEMQVSVVLTFLTSEKGHGASRTRRNFNSRHPCASVASLTGDVAGLTSDHHDLRLEICLESSLAVQGSRRSKLIVLIHRHSNFKSPPRKRSVSISRSRLTVRADLF